MLNAKERSLKDTYRKMDSSEIERRLKDPMLTPLAAEIARSELARRSEPKVKKPAEPFSFRIVLRALITFVVLGLPVLLLAYWLLPPEVLWPLIACILPGIAMYIGKAFPGLGLSLGGLLMTTPLWLAAYFWHSGEASHGGDFQSIGNLLYGFLFIAGSAFGMGVGGWMIKGALHEGSWEDFEKEAKAQRDDAFERISQGD